MDKTASFVARNGPQFEERIKENEKNNSKFGFLNANDPYRGYYDFKVKELKEGKGLLFAVIYYSSLYQLHVDVQKNAVK